MITYEQIKEVLKQKGYQLKAKINMPTITDIYLKIFRFLNIK